MKSLPDGIVLIRFCVMKKVKKYMTLHSKKFSAFLFFKAYLHQKERSEHESHCLFQRTCIDWP